jgi:hypothetical protein
MRAVFLQYGVESLLRIAQKQYPQEAFDLLELQRLGPRERVFSLYQRDILRRAFMVAGVKEIEVVDRRLSDIPFHFGHAEARRMGINDQIVEQLFLKDRSTRPAGRLATLTDIEERRAKQGQYTGMILFAHLYLSPNKVLTVLDTNIFGRLRIESFLYYRSVSSPVDTYVSKEVRENITIAYSGKGTQLDTTQASIQEIRRRFAKLPGLTYTIEAEKEVSEFVLWFLVM